VVTHSLDSIACEPVEDLEEEQADEEEDETAFEFIFEDRQGE
jgi:hypothetical protein